MERKRFEEHTKIKNLEINELFAFPEDFDGIRLNVEWISKDHGITSDMDLSLLCYDERARFIEKIDATNKQSKDSSCTLITNVDSGNSHGNSHIQCVKIDFRTVSKATTAVLLLLDVGPRNFQFLQSINMQCVKVLPDRKFGEYLPSESSAGKNSPVFQTSCRSRKNYQGLIMCLVYKDGWSGSKECPNWVLKCFLEPVLTSSQKEKEDICGVMVVNSVPELEKYRPHLFSSIRDICAALSSRSLPKLKKKFLKDEAGLPIGQFTEVLFRQLYETHPRIADDSEAPYAVAMLQEMFHQIDYNGDQTTNWDEFTTFCVQTGVVEHISSGGSTYSLDDYIIEYGEEPLQRDHILSGYRLVCQMRHIPENRKLVVIPEESDNVMILDERFRMHSQIYPAKVHVVGTIRTAKTDSEDQRKKHGFVPRAIIYDCIYLTGRDLYCYCSSDHSITICKELSSLGGKRVNYIQHNRFYHSLLHMKLCWSEKHNILCSTASDRTIYGWNIDDSSIIFQINRHSDNITDFICVDALDIFITCGMDKRIVMWSAVSRRVKGILLGHKRGVRCLSQYENTLLSAGFELEAKTWDMAGKDCVAVLRGHRSPIVCARLMCAHAHSEKDYRAITVDEGGEFRLWNIYVRERTSDPVPVPTLQIFNMQNPESPLDGFRFLALPYSPLFSTSYYSDIIACSTKLLHFLPEKNVKEFIPPTACKINEASSSVVTSVGKNILLYDIGLGRFSNVFEEVSSADITALCMDGERGRKMFLGNSAGNIMLVNSTTGVIIDRLVDSHSRDVTAILQSAKSNECIYSSSLDGHIRRYEQSNGQLNVHNFIDYAFGEGIGVTSIKLAETIHILVATSAGKMWGLWHNTSFKKLLVIHEEEIVTAVEIIGVSRDAEDITMKMSSTSEKSIIKPSSATKSSTIQNSSHGASTVEKENMMTLAVAVPSGVIVYTFDVVDMRGIRSFKLCTDRSLYITDLTIIKSPDISSVNYSSNLRDYGSSSHGYQLVASTDDGNLVLWDTSGLRTQSDWKFRKRFQGVPPGKKHLKFLSSRRPSSASSRDDVSAGNVYISGSSKKGDALSFKDTSKLLKQSTAAGSILSVGNDVEKHAGLHSHDQRSAGNRKEQVEVASSWIELTSTEMFVLAQGEKDAEVVMSRRIWNAHSDIIPFAVPLHSHGCLVTVSHDGYHRMWNLDAECLGELALPNITESMKKNSRCNEPGTAWKFILEKIPVTQGHIDVANALRMNMRINPSRGRRMDVQTMERRNNGLAAGFRGFRDASIFSNEEENEIPSPRSQVRRQVLHSLSEPPAAPDDVPPSRVPTKEEKELLRLSLNLEEPAFRSGKSNIMKNSNEMPLSAPGNIESFQRGDSKNFATKSFVENSLSKKDQSMLGKSWMAGSTDSLMMSYFGVPSLWYVPGDKDIFGNTIQTTKTVVSEKAIPAAFSETSLYAGLKSGLFDAESQRILRKVGANLDNVSVYERSQPKLLLRSPSLTTAVQLPALDKIQRTEISFGVQKDMYKNAERVLNDRDNVSKTQIRNAVTKSRIDSRVKRVSSMIHLIQPPSHDEVILPKNDKKSVGDADDDGDEASKLRSEEQKMKLRLLKSAAMVPPELAVNAQPLNRERLNQWMSRVYSAEHAVDTKHYSYQTTKKKKRKEVLTQAAINLLEKKLQLAIRGEYRSRMAAQNKQEDDKRLDTPVSPTKKSLTTRMLLPYYKLDNVNQFMDIFAKVDENFSGDLDVNEWIKLFTSLDESIPTQEARMIFMKIDKDSDGFLTMRELIPVVFNRANKEQQRLIIQYAEAELTKKHHDNVPKISRSELEQLFDAYDSDRVGFVNVSFIKDRIKTFHLSEQALFFFFETVSDLADDEMVNLTEFMRIFKPFATLK